MSPERTPCKMNIHFVTCCNSQYFGGHHLPVFQIEVDNKTTGNILKMVMSDWQTTDHLEYEVFRFEKSGDMFDAAVEEWFKDIEDMGVPLFPDFDEAPEDEAEREVWYEEYDCCAFFVVEIEYPEDDDEEQLSSGGAPCSQL